jgi:hypothetical protein
MKSYKQYITEKLQALRRMSSAEGPAAEEKRKKFTMRQAARAAAKYGSNDEFVTKQNKKVPSYYGIGAQFGVDTRQSPTGEYEYTPYTPTEDQALGGDLAKDKKHQELFKKTFLSMLARRKAI